MRKRINPLNNQVLESEIEVNNIPPFSYSANEDIYLKSQNEADVNPENISEVKVSNEVIEDNDLDVPGSELDDQQEFIGSEDEENNYYSIAGDLHNDLEEDKQ